MNRILRTLRLLPLTAFLLLPATGMADDHEAAEAPAERSVTVTEKIQLKGKVVSIDREARSVVVEGERGRQVEIHAPEDSPNFDQIQVGDPVKATYLESVALAIAPVEGAEPGAEGVAAVSTAPPGATPAAAVAEQIELRAVVKAVDVEARTVTLEGPRGERTLKVREGVDLARVQTGEEVTLTLTRALAIKIDKE